MSRMTYSVVQALGRSRHLGRVPGPHLIRRGRYELRLDIRGMPSLRPPLAHLVGVGEHAVHRACRAQILIVLEQLCVDLHWRLVHEGVAVEHGEHADTFVVVERAGRPRARLRRRRRLLRSVVARAIDTERDARGDDAHDGDEKGETLHQRRLRTEVSELRAKSSAVGVGSVSPSRLATFFWTLLDVKDIHPRTTITSPHRPQFGDRGSWSWFV